jgi:hypothetical protein
VDNTSLSKIVLPVVDGFTSGMLEFPLQYTSGKKIAIFSQLLPFWLVYKYLIMVLAFFPTKTNLISSL